MSEQNKTVIHRLVDEVWKKRNPSRIDEFLASNSVIHSPDGTLHGSAGYRQFYNTYATAFPDCDLVIEDLIAEGNKVAAYYTFRGTHRGELLGIAPTGRSISMRGSSIFRIENGKIMEDKVVWDVLGLMRQLGVSTQAAQAKGKGAR